MNAFTPLKGDGHKQLDRRGQKETKLQASGAGEKTAAGASHENDRVKEKLPGKMQNISSAKHNV